MRKAYGHVVLVTGASSGIGKSTAEIMARNGYRVYGTSRKVAGFTGTRMMEEAWNGGFIEMIPLDVCSGESARKAVAYVLEKEGSLDILVNNAGFGIAGSVEDTAIEEAASQFDTNFFGVLRMCREALPAMRKQKRGLIVNISSVAGRFSVPYQSMYSASKSAVEALSEVLRNEVKPFGIRVTIVEPGDTRTGFTECRRFSGAANAHSVYWESFQKAVNTMIRDETNGPEPEKVAKVVLKLARKSNPPIRTAVDLKNKVMLFARRFVPERLVLYVLSKMY